MRLSTASSLLLSAVLFFSATTTAQGNGGGFPDLKTLTDTSSSKASKTTGGSAKNTDSGAITSPGSLSSSYDGIVNAPTVVNGDGAAGVPTYPPPTIPPTADAPFMQHSTLPQGTVFISVGAVLGLAFVVVIAWRVLVVWSVHRSMKRATRGYALMDTNGKGRIPSESKSMLMTPFLGAKDHRGSSLSLDPLTAAGRSQTKTPLAAATERQSLFFSPTAGAGAPTPVGDRNSVLANRTSTYLPAGYYQTPSAAAGGVRPISTQDLGGSGGNNRPASAYRSSSTQNLLVETRPNSLYRQSSDQSGNYTPQADLQPPLPYGRHDSPRLSSGGFATPGPEVRAPSAFLDDLFDYPAEPQSSSRP